jgi:16S rRNA (guanine1207-N2)-methyltransferase
MSNARLPAAITIEEYSQTAEFATVLAGQSVHLVARPAFPSSAAISPALELLAEHAPRVIGRALLVANWPGALAVALARQAPHADLWLTATNVIALDLAQQTLTRNDVPTAHIILDPARVTSDIAACDSVLLETPPDRQLARRWLAAAFTLLRPGGRLFLAGTNQQGIRSIIADAHALFGACTPLAYRGRARIATAVKSNIAGDLPDWFWQPGIHPLTWHVFAIDTPAGQLRLHSLPGVFAYDRLDDGTALLLEHLDVSPAGRVLDVGCGSGVIGLTAARLGATHVDLIDVNLLAIAAAQQNIASNQIDKAAAFPSDVLDAVSGRRYDLIVSNPPFHEGKEVSYRVANALNAGARHALVPGGRLTLVANRFIPYDRLMQRVFDNVTILAATSRYHVLCSTATA